VRLVLGLSLVVIFSSCSLTLISKPAFAETPTGQAAGNPTKDPAAVQLLTSMINACGWNTTLPLTVIANGTMGSGNSTGEPVVVESKPGWLRIQRPQSNFVFLVHGAVGEIVSDGATQPLSGGEAISSIPLMFPFYTEIVTVNDPSLSLTYGEATAIDQTPVQVIGLASTAQLGDGLDSIRQTASSIRIAIAKDTLLPISFRFYRMSHETDHEGTDVDAYLGDFRKVSGMLMPFRYEERIGNQTTFVLQFQSIVLNQSISDQISSSN
jgi:hypothetical protein